MNNADYLKSSFNSIGWFIPPYVSRGFLDQIYKKIENRKQKYTQIELERELSFIYSPEHLAAMALHRYPITPHICEYAITISEAISAHFSRLDHIAVAGLMPVIEGAGKALAKSWNISLVDKNQKSPIKFFSELTDTCKKFSRDNNIGMVGEIASMMDSFKNYTKENLYIYSDNYVHSDKTNRHGILHGAYKDCDFGTPLNFYKSIGTIEFLCFISAFKANISWFAPDPCDQSRKIAKYYLDCHALSFANPQITNKFDDPRTLGVLAEELLLNKRSNL